MYENELYHHGVKGMKWGVRKNRKTSGARSRVNSAKAEYKSARKTSNKSYNNAYRYSRSHPVTQFATKKGRAKSDALWEQAVNDAKRANSTKSAYKSAKSAYKNAKRERKTAIKNTHMSINKKASFGDKFLYSDGTRKLAAKYVVDNNMSISEANKKAKSVARRNTAAFIAAYGAVAIGYYALNK